MGVDPGFGSSAFGIVVTRFVDGKAQIIFADEFSRPDYDEMLQLVLELRTRYGVDKIYLDGANPEFCKSIKMHIGRALKSAALYRVNSKGEEIQEARRDLYESHPGPLFNRA